MSMFEDRLKHRTVLIGAGVIAAITLGLAPTAWSQQLFFEDFEDEMLAANAAIGGNTTITGGVALMDDLTTNRATFSVVQNFTAPVITFSFDVVEPVTEGAGGMELLLRAGQGTAQGTLQNADQMVEAIMYRGPAADPTRGDYQNNGDESIFLVANNKATELMFNSPIDGAQVTLAAWQYIPYVKNNETGMFGQIKGVSNYTTGTMANWGTFSRFGIGSSSTGHSGTFGIDNVLAVEGVNFEGVDPGPPPVLGDTDGDMIGGEFPDDFDPIKANFRKAISARNQGDLVDDNVINFKDFREWKAAHLAAGGSLEGIDFSFVASVPEPGSLALLVMGACAACRARRVTRVRHIRRF